MTDHLTLIMRNGFFLTLGIVIGFALAGLGWLP
jgi:hypothetical protein